VSTFPIIYTSDIERSLRFYRDELAFSLKFRWPEAGAAEYVYLERDGSGLGLGRPTNEDISIPSRTGLPATFLICTYVEDLDLLFERLSAHKVKQLASPSDKPWGERVAYVQDPDGYPVMLIQRT
jgi:catechol 2,3-dioxygenase-like lactoylglutathione lyase family enzyme